MDESFTFNKVNNPLIDAIKSGRVAHAYIVSGKNGSEKSRLVSMAKGLMLCPSMCGTCPECVKAASGNHPDVMEIRLKKKTIGIDEMRACISDLSQRPVSVQRRVVIIYGAEFMTPPAQNCLLKTLESPPSYAVFLLVCENVAGLLPTVVSRCAIIRLGAGDLREEYREDPAYGDMRGKIISVFCAIKASHMIIEGYPLRAYGDKMRLLLSVAIEVLHDVSHVLYNRPELCIGQGDIDSVKRCAQGFTPGQIKCMIKILFDTEARLLANVNPKTAFDYWFVSTQEVLK